MKEYIKSYAKYLGLDGDKLIDEFNSYMFEYTSKIPVKEIEQLMKQKEKEEAKEEKVVSPYTMEVKKHKKNFYVFMYLAIILIVVIVIVWSLKQLTINKITTNEISYVEEPVE